MAVALGMLSLLLLRRYRRNEKVRTALVCSSLFILFTLTASFFDYLLVTTDAPLIDATLAAWDHRLGFEWPAAYAWTKRHPGLDVLLGLAYSSVFPQISALIVYLSFTGRRRRLAEFNTILIASFFITCLISVYFPAAGPAKFYGSTVHADVSSLSDFEPLRNGMLRTFDAASAQGLVSFPSFHAILAILLAYAMRRTKLFPLFLILNGAVLLSTPTRGQHYLVDLIAGAVTVTAMMMVFRDRGRSRDRVVLSIVRYPTSDTVRPLR